MALRPSWFLWCILCLGCQSVVLPDGESEPDNAPIRSQDGQAGEAERPLGYYDKDLAGDPAATRSALSLAAEALQQGDEAAACQHLGNYLAAHPDHHEVRLHFAELLLRSDRRGDARTEFMRCIAQAQERGDMTLEDRIHCHSRLMEIADADDDRYALHYHRGVGLYLLAQERSKLDDQNGPLPLEGLLCQAAGELSKARSARPMEAQPCWYLYKVWSALGQESAARSWLARAMAAAPFAPLTPSEQRSLELAYRMQDSAPTRP
jgi:hypothetical protein